MSFRSLERVWVNYVGQVDTRVVTPRQRNGKAQSPIGNFGKVGRDQDLGQRHPLAGFQHWFNYMFGNVRHNSSPS